MDHTIHYDNFDVASMMIIVALISLFISSIVIPYFLSTSKIEEGTIVQEMTVQQQSLYLTRDDIH